MEALLPSEIARLVLGYLEEEKCGDAAKCFLNSSPHLGEIRALSQRGKKYPTKVNGLSLKDVLEEYCTVHTIVQESVSSMSEQPNGTMIECLQSLVRACQPVQVHINLHPHQGQNALSSKSENSEMSTFSSRPRSRKTNSHGQIVEGDDSPDQPIVFPQILPDSSSTHSPFAVANIDSTQSAQHVPLTPPVTTCKSQIHHPNQNSNTKLPTELSTHQKANAISQLANQMELRVQENSLMAHSESSAHQKADAMSHTSTFKNDCIDSFQEPAPLLTPGQMSVTSQHLVHVSSVPQSAVMQVPRTEFTPQPGENVSLPSTVPDTMQRDFSKTEEPVRSYTVTKCFGSNIVILENDDPQSSLPISAINSSNITKAEDGQKLFTKLKIPTPIKTNPPAEHRLTEGFLRNGVVEVMVEKVNQELVEEISSDDSQKHIEGSQSGERKKHLRKKKSGSSNQLLYDNLVADAVYTPSKVEPEKSSSAGINFLPDGVTPAKGIMEVDNMTPMTKLLKSITSPSNENYLDPTQFASLIDIPESATKFKEKKSPVVEVPAVVPQGPPPPIVVNESYKIQMPPTINYVYCQSNQQISQYLNEKGVSTLYTDEVQIMPPLAPILPKVQIPRAPSTSSCGSSQTQEAPKNKKRQSRPKRCITRGGRQSAGQIRSSASDESNKEKNTVTLYAADGKDVSTTISYSASSDMPILVSDVSEEIAEAQHLDTHAAESCFTKPIENEGIEETAAHPEIAVQPEIADQPQIIDKPEIASQPDIVTQPETVPQPETSDVISEEKEDSFTKGVALQSQNSSVVRNTPGFTGRRRPLVKRTSLSTPRRRHSHIRALDFSTPTKDLPHDQSMRRANTSPKNMSINALSPRTTGKTVRSSVRGSLFKAPGDKSQRTSKAKAHLFKSPEYIMGLSSGFKNPVVTSTPDETCSKVDISVARLPSEAWDKVGGVSLILDTDISPVKRKEPTCKKTLGTGAWDSDLRSLLPGSQSQQPPPPVSSRKRKNTQPAGKKKPSKKSKVVEVDESTKADDNSLNNTQDICNESEMEMAKRLETNLMNSSSEPVSPVKQVGISGVQTLPSPPKPDKADNKEDKSDTKETIIGNESKSVRCTPSSQLNDKSNPLNGSIEIDEPNITTTSAKPLASEEACNVRATEEQVVAQDSQADDKIKTPVPDPSAVTEMGRIRMNQATWKESFSFDTPVKDDMANIIPQTPRFLDPSTASGEDTPRTKIIKAIPYCPVQSAGTPIPTVPPTPTIHATSVPPTVSPNGPAYFEPIQPPPVSSSPRTSAKGQSDNLESILIKECSRMEAGGIRQMSRKPVLGEVSINSSEGDSEDFINTNDKISKSDHIDRTKEKESYGCARLRCYQRKTTAFNELVRETFPGLLHTCKNKNTTSGDDTDECLIVSPSKPCDQKPENFGCKTKSNKDSDPLSPSTILEDVKSDTSSRAAISITSQMSTNIDGMKIEEALNIIHGSSIEKLPKMTPQKVTTIILSPAKQIALCKKSLSTPVKPKIQRTKTPSSKKKKSAPQNSIDQSTDDESSDSSSSDSSSSDSDSNNSSSSSSEEGTPVKGNISSVKIIPSKVESQSDMPSFDDHRKAEECSIECPSKEVQEPRPDKTEDVAQSSPNAELEQNNHKENVQESRSEVIEDLVQSIPNPDLKQNNCEENEDLVQSIPNPDLKQNNCEENEAVLEPLTEGEIVEIPSIEKESKKESFSKPLEVSADKNKPQVSEAPIESQQAFGTESTVSKGCNESFKQKEDHLKGNVDLKSLVQTKDMGSCEKLAKSRNSLLKNKSCYMSELTEIRLRTIAQFKGNQGRKDSKKKVSTLSGSCSKPEPSRSKTNLDTKTVHEGSVKTLTKDIAVCKEMPKKRRSKSETDSSVHLKEPKDNSPKRRSVSDSAKVLSDDDEFILRLSGDEKEETERESIVAEMQVTSLPNEVMKDLQVPVETSKTTVTKTSITTPESSSKPVLPSKQRVNDVSKRVDSKAADNVLQALLEKGFNYSLPSLPSTRIKKIAPNVKSEDSQKKSAEPVIDSRAQKPSPASTLSESKLLKSSENSTKINECSDDVNEEMSETVNTSITNFTREVIVKYSGLGPTKPKIDVFPISAKQLVQMDEGSISLSPSNFFSLYNINPKVNTSEADSERRRRRIDSTRTGPEGCSVISRYSNSRNSRNTRTRGLRDSNSGDRGAMRREGNQSRRNQSPPPRHRHSRDYSNDRSHYRDSHYSQEYYDRSKRDSRKEEASSSRSRKPSDCRSAKALKPYPKVSSIDAEDGEILSSDGEFETKTSSKRVRPSSQEKKKSMRENRTVQESVSRRKETDQSSSTSKPKPIIRHRICPPSTSGKVNYNLESDEMNDLDLDDDANFPVLGDDDLEENDCKGTDQNSSKESNSSGGMVLRRAPPRSVNAHKVSETQTPTQRGKRKLSISPDVVSEDSCQSTLSVVNPDGKQMQSSRQTKKRLSTTSGKVLKSSENEDVANCSEIIKNLNVDAFLSKIHG